MDVNIKHNVITTVITPDRRYTLSVSKKAITITFKYRQRFKLKSIIKWSQIDNSMQKQIDELDKELMSKK